MRKDKNITIITKFRVEHGDEDSVCCFVKQSEDGWPQITCYQSKLHYLNITSITIVITNETKSVFLSCPHTESERLTFIVKIIPCKP